MALDLDAFPAKVKLKQITVGKGFGSTDTLAQANDTLDAHGKYADDVAADGFIAVAATRLTEARDGLIAAGVGRETVKGGKKTTSKAYVGAMDAAQTVRMSTSVRDRLAPATPGASQRNDKTVLSDPD